jgi:hypothetical protein
MHLPLPPAESIIENLLWMNFNSINNLISLCTKQDIQMANHLILSKVTYA